MISLRYPHNITRLVGIWYLFRERANGLSRRKPKYANMPAPNSVPMALSKGNTAHRFVHPAPS